MAECIFRSLPENSKPICTLLGGKDNRECRLPTSSDDDCPVALFKHRQIEFVEANSRLVNLGARPLVDSLQITVPSRGDSNLVKIIEQVMGKYGPFMS
jgi:hypothetical protein